MVARRRLHRASEEWQSCALRATGILSSQTLLDSAPDSVDDVTIALLSLLFVGRHGTQFVSDVGNVLATSALGRTHPLLVGMEAVIVSEGMRKSTLIKDGCMVPSFVGVDDFLPPLPPAWQQGCGSGAGQDPRLPSAATEAMIVHLGKQLARIGPEGTETLVSKHTIFLI